MSLYPSARTWIPRTAARAAALLIVLAILLVAYASASGQEPPVEPQAVATVINSNIVADTTWTLAGSPYDVTADIIVNPGVTLTIEPGVTVRFAEHTGLRIQGTLIAAGTANNRIIFTGSTQQKGWWENIQFLGTAGAPLTGSTLDNVTVEYGGESYGGIYLYYATVNVTHSTFQHNELDGIYADNDGLAHISDTIFTNNGSAPNHYAVRFIDGSMNPTLANLAATGPGANAVAMGSGILSGNHVWERMGLPYVLIADEVVAAGATLTVQPGVEVRFAEHVGLRVQGKLTAVGTAADRILFTGTSATKGWWENIQFLGTADAPLTDSVLDYVTVEYGGESYGGIYLYYATVPITHAVIQHSELDGIYSDNNGLAQVSDTTIANNGTAATHYALRYTDGSMNPVLSNLTVTGNGNDAIALGSGTLSGDHVWEALGVPYDILADEVVAAGATLTIQAGVTVRFAEHVGLRVEGKLTAVGSESSRITFTGTRAQKGWWENIQFLGSQAAPLTGSVLDYVTIEYGGESYGALYLYYATLPVSHAIIRESELDGFYGDNNGLAHFSHTSFVNNGSQPIHFALRYANAGLNATLSNLTLTGNTQDAIAIGGGVIEGDHVWEALGYPFVVLYDVHVAKGASLTIEPGVTVKFSQHAGLRVLGRLSAYGQADAPILLTGTAPQRGWWENLSFQGTQSDPGRGSVLRYVTIEYAGGSYANIYIYYSTVSISDSIIRESRLDGILADSGGGGSTITNSSIVSNEGYGAKNRPHNSPLNAANNWWGAAGGPVVDNNCNAGGTGSPVSHNVAYQPFLTASDGEVSTVAPPSSYSLSVAPQRWFIPADGVTRGEVLITLRDGEGNPVPGRQIHLDTTHGSALSGGFTDARGEARARIWASNPGNAMLTASIDDANPCSTAARSGTAEVTFTEFVPGNLMPDAAAPYMNTGLEFTPEPIVQGVLTRITARVVNPNNFPISINGNFGILQSGIGLALPPVGSVEDHVIPANSVGVISLDWTPPISGHYCVVFDYNWTQVGAEAGAASGAQRSQKNLNVYGGTPNDYSDKDILNKASKYGTYVGGLGNGTGEGFIPGVGATILTEWQLTMGARISRAMGGDPPRQDFTTIEQATPVLLAPVQAGGSVSAAMAGALNDLRTAMAWANAHGSASIVSYDRYGGAAAAGNLTWASQQISAMNFHKHEMAKRLLDAADALDAYRAARQAAGIADAVVTADNLRAYQERLATSGFSAEEIAAARAVGMTDAEIEEVRQQHIAADPDEQAGGLNETLTSLAADYRRMAGNILYPPTFGGSVGGSAGMVVSADIGGRTDIPPMPQVPASNNLARVYEVVDTILVGNPTGQTAVIDMKARPVDLPADWMVTITPISLTLPAGGQSSVEVRITPGGPSVQGTTPRVAIEGYAGDQLLGGVTMDVIVPKNVLKPEPSVYLPMINKP